MSKLKTTTNFGSNVELADVKFLCTAKLQKNHVALIPLETDSDGKKHVTGDGFLLSFEDSIQLAVNILSEVIGSENPEMIKPIMAKLKSRTKQYFVAGLSD